MLQPHWNYYYAPNSSSWGWMSTPSRAGEWTQVVVTYSVSGGLARIFVNGVEMARQNVFLPIFYGANAVPRLGEQGGIYPYAGRIALMRTWSSALTQGQIDELYRKNASRFGLTAPAPSGITLPAPEAHLEANRCEP